MTKYLSMLENSQPEVSTEEEKFFFFISEVSIWDHFGITENTYIFSTVDEKTKMLNGYYHELYKKYYGAGKNVSFFCFLSWGCWLSYCFFFLWFIGSVASNTVTDSSISSTIQRPSKIYLTKNIALPEQNIETTNSY